MIQCVWTAHAAIMQQLNAKRCVKTVILIRTQHINSPSDTGFTEGPPIKKVGTNSGAFTLRKLKEDCGSESNAWASASSACSHESGAVSWGSIADRLSASWLLFTSSNAAWSGWLAGWLASLLAEYLVFRSVRSYKQHCQQPQNCLTYSYCAL